jgi:hypothetical protein
VITPIPLGIHGRKRTARTRPGEVASRRWREPTGMQTTASRPPGCCR